MNRTTFLHLGRRRGTLASVLLLACVLSGGILYWHWQRQPLPDPQSATAEQLVRWLALHEVERLSNDEHLALVERFESEFQRSRTSADDATMYSPSWVPSRWMARLKTNLAVLKRVWFMSRVEMYANCAEEQRLAFLRKRLDVVMRWNEMSSAPYRDESAAETSPSFFHDIEQWLASMPDSQRKQAESALTDGLICWLACYDLSGQPHAVRAELAHRIVEQLKRDHQAGQLGLPLNAAERLQLAENAKLLMESWAIELSKQFVALPAHQRDPFVDQLLVNIDDWGLRKWLFPASATELSTSQVQLTQTINAWIARASEEDRSSLREFVKHIQYRVIVLQLRRWLPGRDRA